VKSKTALRLFAGAFAITASAHAADPDDLTALKVELDALRSEYDAKIESLEARLKAAESKANSGVASSPAIAASGPQPAITSGPQPVVASAPQPSAPVATVASSTAPVAASGRTPVSANAYNPGVAVVLNGTYAAFERDPEAASIPGFILGEEAGLEPRGFSLGESELAINANIDPNFYGNLIFALTDEGEVEIEEAYIQTNNLPGGLTLRAGKFFSGVTYLNEVHNHAWDFIDAPLPYRVFLGNQLGDVGVQAKWLAPTDFYLEAGGEITRGDSFPGGGAANKGAGAYAGYVQTGGDIGASSSWLVKASYLHAKSAGRETDGGDIFTGSDDLAVLSFVYKWAPNGNPVVRNLIVNGEYFFNNESGDFNGTPINLDRTGWYSQAVYQFRRNWRAGLRYARLGSDAVPISLMGSSLDDLGRSPDAISAMLEFDTSEFSRFRLMYTYDDTDVASNNELLLRYTVTYGPHGAHRF